jgi:hypothetical protein
MPSKDNNIVHFQNYLRREISGIEEALYTVKAPVVATCADFSNLKAQQN